MTAAAIPYADPRASFRRARKALIPPPKIQLSTWMEENIILPEGNALAGPLRLWPYQRGIADAIGDPTIGEVTVVKPVRVGLSLVLTGAIGSYVVNDPSHLILYQPTDDDCRDYVVSDLEPTFAASPALTGVLSEDADAGERNTMLARRFLGGSLKVLAAKAPRNFRRHTARVVMMDELDAMPPTTEGPPAKLGPKRAFSFDDRKIVLCSTPVYVDGPILKAYGRSDQRVFEVPCPHCEWMQEILWQHIKFPDGPESAAYECPQCLRRVEETWKRAMVEAGAWRPTKPEVKGHAGFRLNTFISQLKNARWSAIADEFLAAKDDPAELQVVVNTLFGQGWTASTVQLDEDVLAAQAEPFSLVAGDPVGQGAEVETTGIPPEVLLITLGGDTQKDRRELFLLGWQRPVKLSDTPTSAIGSPFCILARHVVYGEFDDEPSWLELDRFLDMRWPHPLGGTIGIDASMLDTGGFFDAVTSFCRPRYNRKVWAVKGDEGRREVCRESKSRLRGGGRLFIAGVDTIKKALFGRLAKGGSIRFSKTLDLEFYRQLLSEEQKVRYHRGQPVDYFERKKGTRAEALDGVVYGIAARHMLGTIDWDRREAALRTTEPKPPQTPTRRTVANPWMDRFRGG